MNNHDGRTLPLAEQMVIRNHIHKKLDEIAVDAMIGQQVCIFVDFVFTNKNFLFRIAIAPTYRGSTRNVKHKLIRSMCSIDRIMCLYTSGTNYEVSL
jgi:hypothetical protein